MAAAEAAAPAAAWPDALDTPELQDRIKRAKVLAVGAGGIGCELLKTLVLSGFEDIEVIDLDTIETSNLNRQFLFRKHHVGKSKAEVAAQVVENFAPGAKITAHHANVKEARFGVDFFRSKDVVLNGLDNLEARRHVNRLCVAAGTPLVESGTAGHKGQVTVHIKGLTECYECAERKSQQKSYPICTLRNTPDKPIHCIVWAKDLLFPRLFGRPEAVTDLDEGSAAAAKPGGAPPPADGAAAGDDAERRETDQGASAAAAEAAEIASFFLRREGEAAVDYARRVFDRLYVFDIERVVGMEALWKNRRPPTPLRLPELLPDAAAADAAIAAAAAAAGAGGSVARALGLGGHAVWGDPDAARVFLAAVVAFLEQRPGDVGDAVFDKDDALAVDFVTAASNLRSSCYAIPPQSSFAAKGMAGNIIHAIATTNAIVSGLLVTEAIKVLAGIPSTCASSFLYERVAWSGRKKAPAGMLISASDCPPPRAGCMVCGQARLRLAIDTKATTLAQFLDKVVRRRLAVNQPALQSAPNAAGHTFEYSEDPHMDDEEAEENAAFLPRALAALPAGGLGHGAVVAVADNSQGGFKVEIEFEHKEDWDEEANPDCFTLEGQLPVAQQQQQPEEEEAAAGKALAEAGAAQGKKRARDAEAAGGEAAAAAAAGREETAAAAPDAKRPKAAAAAANGGEANGGAAAAGGDGSDIILIDDDSEDEVL